MRSKAERRQLHRTKLRPSVKSSYKNRETIEFRKDKAYQKLTVGTKELFIELKDKRD
tara:strand:- start:890 stop:1060 length:171 start_codon:yes stop_codon:yes gene_type:complete